MYFGFVLTDRKLMDSWNDNQTWIGHMEQVYSFSFTTTRQVKYFHGIKKKIWIQNLKNKKENFVREGED